MINTFDVKASERKSDAIFSSLNRLHNAKQSGALMRDEFSKILVSVGDLFANKIKQGKVAEEEILSEDLHGIYNPYDVGETDDVTEKDKYVEKFNNLNLSELGLYPGEQIKLLIGLL